MTTEAEKKESLEELIGELKGSVDPEKLAVFFIATGEQIMGESETDDPKPGELVKVTNPKRILRLQQVQGGGVSISLMVGDLDLLEAGVVSLIPTLVYRVKDQNVDSQLSIYGLYEEYLERKLSNRAVESGIVLPRQGLSGTSPFRKR